MISLQHSTTSLSLLLVLHPSMLLQRERLLKNMNHDTIKTRHSKGEKLKEFLA